MNKELTQEQKEALERFKSDKDTPGTMSAFFYGLLEKADPRLKQMMEHKAAVLMDAGAKMGKEMAKAEKDPKKKEEMIHKMQEVANRLRSSVQNDQKDKEE
jgi:hypothetical protein